ncbi:transducin family protein / WD-40 repeat family protein [Thalictrum thalictroides]|uniref:Transducin family protein / WD-40 repeat family protein n=1 Tax=Thalictrum thalictroides TaxID=46969 RepID=A0A7J6WUH1_THATH|nr:transducin family protein / WD-40 repeat family protein [Thalictrum thalictroides]
MATLEARYLELCRGQELAPNSTIMSGFLEAKHQKSRLEQCYLQIFLDKLRIADFVLLVNLFSTNDASEIDAIDILHGSPCILNGEYVLSLMRAINQKLRIVDLHDLSFGKDFLRDLSHNGLTCQVLNLRSSHIRKLNMTGTFIQLHTLNLDFSISLTGFREDCFTCMPNLARVSICETRVSNLWTTSAALSKLPSLVELRFQNCLCCNDTGACSASPSEKPNSFACSTTHWDNFGMYSAGTPPTDNEDHMFQHSRSYDRNGKFSSTFVDDLIMNPQPLENATEESDGSDVDFTSQEQRMGLDDVLSNMFPELSTSAVADNEVDFDVVFLAEEGPGLEGAFNDLIHTTDGTDGSSKKYRPHHPSPICFEKHYREYMVASLPYLKVLDNLPITENDREHAKVVCAQYFEPLPYNRRRKENVVNILQMREKGSTMCHLQQSPKLKQPSPLRKSQYFFTRSISSAKVASSAWPFVHSVPKLSSVTREESKRFRPRQFEYHPSDSSLMVFGTLDGEIVVVNHESGNIVGYMSSGTLNSVLGLCWLKRDPLKLIAGSDNGSLQLYDIRRMLPSITERQYTANIANFDDFEQLTSVHVNSTDEQFIASGYSKDVALYDIGSGKHLQTFTDMHRGHINVVKFAHHSPSIFVTSSFDQDVKMWDLRQRPLRPCYTASSSRGNVMVCFSPDDHYLLSSAVDNEVKQLLAVDGRVHMKFEIPSSGSSQNYTRSYYMNGRDYIISGSSDEQVVHICCAQTGRRLRDVPLEAGGFGTSMFVQSLRGDPFRDFHMSVLAAYMRPSSKSEIIKVNLMKSNESDNQYSYFHQSHISTNMGA